MIFLIEKAWADSLENNASEAFGYSVVGFVASEEEAKVICDNGGDAPVCWVNRKGAPLYRYRKCGLFKDNK